MDTLRPKCFLYEKRSLSKFTLKFNYNQSYFEEISWKEILNNKKMKEKKCKLSLTQFDCFLFGINLEKYQHG